MKVRRKKFRLVDERALWLMLIPVIVYFLIFKYIPVSGIIIAFKRYSPFKGIAASPWVGFLYFKQFFHSVYFGRVLRNTLMIGFLSIVFAFPMPIILALLLNGIKNKIFKKISQTITLLPYFVSFVVIAGIAINFLSPSTGVINGIIKRLGGNPIYFMQEPKYFWFIYIFLRIFKGTGYTAIIYLAALTAIDPNLYEAADCDGAGRFKKLIYITLPGILPTIIIMFLVRIGRLISVSFEEVLLLQNDVILSTAEVISTFVYRRGLIGADYSYATAVGLFETVIALFLVIFSNKLAGRFRSEATLW
ncbi:MAG: sugar ABC transporter permease [Spirochaetales bacterium]|nr:sugar ABC transporter permease [Spirochaetales bacterium]